MIQINMDKAKSITHVIRREARAKEFQPYDEIIAKRIPGNDLDNAEAQREAIREKYAEIQAQINSCTDADSLKTIVEELKEV